MDRSALSYREVTRLFCFGFPRPALPFLGSRPSVPADSRVTFFPKPKKVTKEGFALRLALLARGGRCVYP
jgi:hypothetical protein